MNNKKDLRQLFQEHLPGASLEELEKRSAAHRRTLEQLRNELQELQTEMEARTGNLDAAREHLARAGAYPPAQLSMLTRMWLVFARAHEAIESGDEAHMPYGQEMEMVFVREDGVWRIEDPD